MKSVCKPKHPDFRSDPARLPGWLVKNKIAVLCEDEMQFYDLTNLLKDSRIVWVWENEADIWRSYREYHLSDRSGKMDKWLPGLAVSVDRHRPKRTDQRDQYSVGWCYKEWYETAGLCVIPYCEIMDTAQPDIGDLF